MLAALAGLLAGLARGFSGFGAALIFMPLSAAALGPRLAAPLLLVVDAAMTLPLILPAWRQADRHEVWSVAAGALVGAPLGTALLVHADPQALRWALSGLVLTMLALLASGWRYSGRLGPRAAVSVGVVSGFCTGAAQMGGPPVVVAWLGGAIPVSRVRANLLLFFAATGVISAISYAVGGLFNFGLVALAVLVAPAYGLGVWIGTRLFGLASERAFRRACFVLIALAAVIGLPLWDRP